MSLRQQTGDKDVTCELILKQVGRKHDHDFNRKIIASLFGLLRDAVGMSNV
jgi:hypothetical protein